MAFKMKGGSMQKGTKGHKDALSSFYAAKETSSMKSKGIYETFIKDDGEVGKRRISKEEFQEQMAAKKAAGEKPAVNLGGVGLDQGRVNEYVLTGGDINLLPEDVQQGTYLGDDAQATAPQLVKGNIRMTGDAYKDAFPVTADTDLSKVATKSEDRMDKDYFPGAADPQYTRNLIASEGIDMKDFNNFVDNLSTKDRLKLLKGRGGDLSKITKKSELDKVIQTYVNRGGKITKSPDKESIASRVAETDEFGKRIQGTS